MKRLTCSFPVLCLLAVATSLGGCFEPGDDPVLPERSPTLFSPGVLTLHIGTATGLSFDEASVEVSDIAVQKCAEDGEGEWLALVLDDPVIAVGTTALPLPEMEVGTELCSLRIEPSTSLTILGSMEVGTAVEHFLLEMNVRGML